MTQYLQTLIVPLLGLIGTLLSTRADRQHVRLLERLAAARKDLPPTANQHLDAALTALAQEVARKEMRRLSRKVDGASVAAVVFVTMVGMAAAYAALRFNNLWVWLLGGGVAITAILLLSVGVAQVYKYPEEGKP